MQQQKRWRVKSMKQQKKIKTSMLCAMVVGATFFLCVTLSAFVDFLKFGKQDYNKSSHSSPAAISRSSSSSFSVRTKEAKKRYELSKSFRHCLLSTFRNWKVKHSPSLSTRHSVFSAICKSNKSWLASPFCGVKMSAEGEAFCAISASLFFTLASSAVLSALECTSDWSNLILINFLFALISGWHAVGWATPTARVWIFFLN